MDAKRSSRIWWLIDSFDQNELMLFAFCAAPAWSQKNRLDVGRICWHYSINHSSPPNSSCTKGCSCSCSYCCCCCSYCWIVHRSNGNHDATGFHHNNGSASGIESSEDTHSRSSSSSTELAVTRRICFLSSAFLYRQSVLSSL